MAYRSAGVAPVEGGGACEEQRLHVVGVDGERAQDYFFRLSLQRPPLRHRESVRVVREELGVARHARSGLGVGFAGLAEAPQHRVRASQHHPALGILGVVLHARGQAHDRGLELRHGHAVRVRTPGCLRQNRARIADRQVDRQRADRNRQTQRERGAARAARGFRRGFARAHVRDQTRLDLEVRLFVLVRCKCSGAQVGFQLAQLVAIHRGVHGVARLARAHHASCERRHDEEERDRDEDDAENNENGQRRSP